MEECASTPRIQHHEANTTKPAPRSQHHEANTTKPTPRSQHHRPRIMNTKIPATVINENKTMEIIGYMSILHMAIMLARCCAWVSAFPTREYRLSRPWLHQISRQQLKMSPSSVRYTFAPRSQSFQAQSSAQDLVHVRSASSSVLSVTQHHRPENNW